MVESTEHVEAGHDPHENALRSTHGESLHNFPLSCYPTSFDRLLAYVAGVQPLPANSALPPAVSPAVLRLPLGLSQTATSVSEIEEAPC